MGNSRLFAITTDGHTETRNDDVRWTQQTLLLFGFVGVLLLLLVSVNGVGPENSPGPSPSTRLIGFAGLFGVLGLLGFGAFCVGSLLGFLFGIPKLVENSNGHQNSPLVSPDSSSDEQRFRSNTNLEEMSDWLTKIIVGAGLVGLKDLVSFFVHLVDHVSSAIGAAPFTAVVVGADIVGFLILGFFTVYLLTRLFLAGAFTRAEKQLALAVKRAQSIANMNLADATPRELSWLGRVVKAHDKNTVLKVPLDFKRESEDHGALRSLKDRLLVRLKEGGSWQPGKTITLTPLAEQIIGELRTATATKSNDETPVASVPPSNAN